MRARDAPFLEHLIVGLQLVLIQQTRGSGIVDLPRQHR